MSAIILGFITAFTLTFSIIPSIIRVAKQKKLFDNPNARSAHIDPTPSLGGIGIFAGTICAIILWTPFGAIGILQYILAAFVIMFLVGVKDDLMPLSPTKKFLGQILCAVILVYKSHIKITNLQGVMGLHELPELFSFVLSIVTIVGIINAFNLIDGINGLAGSIGLLTCVTFGSWFFLIDHVELSMVAFSLAGAIVAFLKYNFTPAQIFMGDTGSLLVGMICAILAIRFVELHKEEPIALFQLKSAPAIAIGILILPLYDTARVFTKRLMQGKSPFSPDKTHIHHLLLDLGYSHMKSTTILIGVNILFIVIALVFNQIGTMPLLMLELGLALLLSTALYKYATHKKNMLKLDN